MLLPLKALSMMSCVIACLLFFKIVSRYKMLKIHVSWYVHKNKQGERAGKR